MAGLRPGRGEGFEFVGAVYVLGWRILSDSICMDPWDSPVSWSAGLKWHFHHFLQRPNDMFPPSTHSHQKWIGKKCGLEVHLAKTSAPANKVRLALRRGKSRRWWGERGLDTISSAKRSTRPSTSLRSLKRYMFSFLLFRGLEVDVYLSFNCCHTEFSSRPVL